jgi:hypothetical protein
MHEGHTEDGVLSTCGICGCQVHMLDPEEMDWICDPCSLDGWSGFKSAWRVTPGDVVKIGSNKLVVLGTEDFGKQVWLECRREDGTEAAWVQRCTTKLYVQANREEL